MRMIVPLALSNLICSSVLACWETTLKYEISRLCEVQILSLKTDDDFLDDESRWHSYLQHSPGSLGDIRDNVPKSTRKIFRSNGYDTLYCEFQPNGLIEKAYTKPTRWDEGSRKWVSLGTRYVELEEGKLPTVEYHESVIMHCEQEP